MNGPLSLLTQCNCVCEVILQAAFQNRHSLESLAPLLSQTWARRDENTPVISSDHLNEYVCYMFIPVSVICWRGCVSILCDGRSYSLAGGNPMTGGASERSSCDWRRDNALMVQYMCVWFFSCMSLLGFQQWGTTRPCDEGCLYGTAYSIGLKERRPTHKKCVWGSVRFSDIPVSLFNCLGPCFYDGCISISFITSAQFDTPIHTWTELYNTRMLTTSNLQWPMSSTIWCPVTEWNS